MRTESKPKPDTSDRKLRKCLKCAEMFMSEHIGNRMCGRCKGGSGRGGIIERVPTIDDTNTMGPR